MDPESGKWRFENLENGFAGLAGEFKWSYETIMNLSAEQFKFSLKALKTYVGWMKKGK